MTKQTSLLRSRDYQILVLNRTCSIWYQNMLPEKTGTRLHDTRTRFWYQFSGTKIRYRFLVRMSWALQCTTAYSCLRNVAIQRHGLLRWPHLAMVTGQNGPLPQRSQDKTAAKSYTGPSHISNDIPSCAYAYRPNL